MGRYLDAETIRHLSKITHLSLIMHSFNDQKLPSDFQSVRSFLSQETPVLVQPLSDHRIAGYTLIKDTYGESVLMLRVDTPREIYRQGQASMGYQFLSLLLAALVFGAVVLMLLEKQVLLALLSKGIIRIEKVNDLSMRLSVAGRDELSSLAKEIDRMLEAMEKSERALRKAHKDLEIRVQERTAQLSKANELLKSEIMERKLAEEKINASLKEKELLLREIHHRVKNNIQVISSLLKLQYDYIKDKEAQEMLIESQNRIEAMALIHEKLYQTENLSRIDFKRYIETLTDTLFDFYGVCAERILLKIDVDKVSFGSVGRKVTGLEQDSRIAY